MEGEQRRSIIRAPNSRGRTQFEYVPTVIRLHTLTEDQVERLAEGGATSNLGLAGMTFGAAVTAAATLATVEMGTYVFAGFVATLISTSVLTLAFGIAAYRDRRKARKQVDDIKAGRVGYPS